MATTMEALRAGRDRASRADIVEMRLDGVAGVNVAGALEGRTRPTIVTCRPRWEGGAFDGSEEERLRILGEAMTLGADFIDVEWRADRTRLPVNDRTRLVLSHHAFDDYPADLEDRVRAMRAEASRGVIKLAVKTRSLADCGRLRVDAGTGGDQVVIGMGSAGLVTRVCPWLFDSQWTYGGSAAPGQMPVADLIDTYRVRQTGRSTRLYALVGSPLSHSASPSMQNAAFAAAAIDAVYVPLETDSAAEFLECATEFGIMGASVTAPLKTAWSSFGVRIDSAGCAIGAVNTLGRDATGQWEGHNFDVAGFLAPLIRRGLQMTGQRVVVLGAGGAARAAVWALKRQGALVEVTARRTEAAVRVAADLGVISVQWPPRPGWDLLVNATPVGTWPDADASPLERESVRGRIVYDLVYNPPETALMKLARGSGADAIGGLEMLVGQARAQFELWTGVPAPAGVMEQAATKFLQRRVE